MEVLYQDKYLLAINKPSGLLSIQDGYNQNLENVKKILEFDYQRVWTIHRLDKETSGVLVFALDPESHRDLSLQFENRKIIKTYFALVFGMHKPELINIDAPLLVDGDRKHRTIIDHINGKPAKTEVEFLSVYDTFSFIKARPYTGYTHQIRCHLQSISHPILNDPLYSSQFAIDLPDIKFTRLALHAAQITLEHPATKLSMTISAPIPEELADFMDKSKDLLKFPR